jgi:acetolactate synthase-1/2/3 large subunit
MADGVTGDDRAMNRVRYGQRPEDGEQRGNVGKLLGDVPSSKFDT